MYYVRKMLPLTFPPWDWGNTNILSTSSAKWTLSMRDTVPTFITDNNKERNRRKSFNIQSWIPPFLAYISNLSESKQIIIGNPISKTISFISKISLSFSDSSGGHSTLQYSAVWCNQFKLKLSNFICLGAGEGGVIF